MNKIDFITAFLKSQKCKYQKNIRYSIKKIYTIKVRNFIKYLTNDLYLLHLS